MLTPQYSLRRLLVLVTLSAVACLVVGLAARGSTWALAVSMGLLSGVVLLSIQGVMFLIVRTFSGVLDSLPQAATNKSSNDHQQA